MNTLDPYLIDFNKIVKQYLSKAKILGFHANNIKQEIKFLEIFKKEYPSLPYTKNVLILGTPTPFHFTGEKKIRIKRFDSEIIEIAKKYSDNVRLIIGNGVHPEKADLKSEIYHKLFPDLKIEVKSLTPWSFHSILEDLPENELCKVILKMSGEWRFYTSALYGLYRNGRRNIIAIIMKNPIGRKFVYWKVDLRGNEFVTEQIPEVPENSREGRKRLACPYCFIPSQYTTPENKMTKKYKCPICGNYYSRDDYKLK